MLLLAAQVADIKPCYYTVDALGVQQPPTSPRPAPTRIRLRTRAYKLRNSGASGRAIAVWPLRSSR